MIPISFLGWLFWLLGLVSFPSAMAVLPVLGAAEFNFVTVPSWNITVEPQKDVTLWQNVVNITNRPLEMVALNFTESGSVEPSDLENIRLLVDGALVGRAELIEDQLTFYALPSYTLETGNRTIKVVADVIGGSGRTITLSLRDRADVSFVDPGYGAPVLPAGRFPLIAAIITIS